MGRPTESIDPEKRTQVYQLKPHHRSMARDLVAMGELRNKDLARIYGMTESQISIIVNSPVFQAELARLETAVEENVCDVRSGIRLLVPKAEQVLKEELFVDKEAMTLAERKFRLGVAADVLDRAEGRKLGDGGHLHLHQHNELRMETQKMTTEQLKNDIFDLLAG